MESSEQLLIALMDKAEDEHLEFKAASHNYSRQDVCRYCVALANEGGGHLVLGVSDKRPRKIIGTLAFQNEIETLKQQVLQKTHLRVEILEILTQDKRVLLFSIPARPRGLPISIDGSYLVRSGESLVGMLPDQLAKILAETKPDFSAEICVEATLSDLDIASIQDFRERWSKKSGKHAILSLSVEQLLSDAELLIDGKLTYAALILLGTRKALGNYLAQSEVVFEYRSSDATGPAQQRVEFRQGFFGFYDELWKIIDLRNTVQHYQDGLFIWDIKTFNEQAIREAILNAVSHRDYRSGSSVFIRQYPDRIEITNPGGPPPGINLENILWEQAPRNRRLAEAFSKAGLVERSGQGMNRIFEACIRESKGDPDFTNTDTDHFWLTLHGTIKHPEFLRVLEKIGSERLRSFTTADFIVIQAVYDDRSISERYYHVAHKLFDEGFLEKRTPQSGKWILSRKLYAAIGKKGIHTKKSGLDRDTSKALLLKHVKMNGDEGSRLEEMRQILPFLDRGSIQALLRELRDEGLVHSKGTTRAAKWFLGSGPIKQNNDLN